MRVAGDLTILWICVVSGAAAYFFAWKTYIFSYTRYHFANVPYTLAQIPDNFAFMKNSHKISPQKRAETRENIEKIRKGFLAKSQKKAMDNQK